MGFSRLSKFAFLLMCASTSALAREAPKKKTAPRAATPQPTLAPVVNDPAIDTSSNTPPSSNYSSSSRTSSGSPLAAHPSSFEEILDQNSLPTDPAVKTLRVSRPFFGGNYQNLAGSFKAKFGDTSLKYQADGTNFGFQGIYPTSLGLRVGGFYEQTDIKIKLSGDFADGTTSKTSATAKGILLSGAFQNGFGVGAGLYDVEEKRTVSTDLGSVSVDEHYGYIVPSVYYGNKTDEITLSYLRSMRHKTGTIHGKIDLNLEHDLGEMNAVAHLRNNRRSENADDQRDNYEATLGLRFFLEQKSNILASLHFEEPYYASPRDADPFSVAVKGLEVSCDYWVAPEHVVGGYVTYYMAEGRGGEADDGSRSKHDGTALGIGLSYSYRM